MILYGSLLQFRQVSKAKNRATLCMCRSEKIRHKNLL